MRAVRSLLERQRVANESVGTLDAIAVAIGDGEANAQVFQVRDGVLSDRQSFYLENAAGAELADVAEAFILQYYASAIAIPPLMIVQQEVGHAPRSRRRSPSVAARGSRSGMPSAATSGESSSSPSATRALALDQEKLRSERRRQQRVEALDGLQRALGLDVIPLRIECFDISTLMGTNTVASMVVFEGARPRGRTTGGSRCGPSATRGDGCGTATASTAPMTSRRWRRSLAGGWHSSSASSTSRRTTTTMTRASRRYRT